MNSLFPVNEIPTNGASYCRLAGQTVPWLDFDSEERFKKNGGHPLYGPTDISYSINSHGFRSPDFSEQADIRVLSIGCSFVLGLGLPKEALFHELFCSKLQSHTGLKVANFNLGSSGTGNDYIARMLALALPIIKPNVVLVNFSEASRLEYLTILGDWIKYGPGNDPAWFDQIGKDVHLHLNKLRSPYQEELRLFSNYKAVTSYLRETPWVHSFLEAESLKILSGHLVETNLAGWFEKRDVARDHVHPGPKSHEEMAERYWRVFLSGNGLFRLQSSIV